MREMSPPVTRAMMFDSPGAELVKVADSPKPTDEEPLLSHSQVNLKPLDASSVR